MLKTFLGEIKPFIKRVYNKYVNDAYGVKSPGLGYDIDEMEQLKLSLDLIKSKYKCEVCTDLIEIDYLPEASKANITNVYNICQIGSGNTFVFNQTFASSLWTVTHNLNYYPNVRTEDHIGNDIEGLVTYISANELTITFSTDFIGKAYLS
jgi:hypothetical protein